jgi:hypothetical protein
MAFTDIFSRDIAAAFREIGSLVVYGAFTTYGILNHEPTDVLAMSEKAYTIQDTTLTLIIGTGLIGTVRNNTSITVAGIAYKIDHFIITGNGLETKLWLVGMGS